MTVTDEHTDLFGYAYEYVDESELPQHERGTSPGRKPAPNPHAGRMKALAGTGDSAAFRVKLETDDPDTEAKRALAKHTRWLRTAAHENSRGVRVWNKRLPEGELKIYFRDIPYTARPRKPKAVQPALFAEGNPDE